MCSLCNRHEETIDHIVPGCLELAKRLSVFKDTTRQLHIYIRNHVSTTTSIVSDKWFEHEPATVTENKEATIL